MIFIPQPRPDVGRGRIWSGRVAPDHGSMVHVEQSPVPDAGALESATLQGELGSWSVDTQTLVGESPLTAPSTGGQCCRSTDVGAAASESHVVNGVASSTHDAVHLDDSTPVAEDDHGIEKRQLAGIVAMASWSPGSREFARQIRGGVGPRRRGSGRSSSRSGRCYRDSPTARARGHARRGPRFW